MFLTAKETEAFYLLAMEKGYLSEDSVESWKSFPIESLLSNHFITIGQYREVFDEIKVNREKGEPFPDSKEVLNLEKRLESTSEEEDWKKKRHGELQEELRESQNFSQRMIDRVQEDRLGQLYAWSAMAIVLFIFVVDILRFFTVIALCLAFPGGVFYYWRQTRQKKENSSQKSWPKLKTLGETKDEYEMKKVLMGERENISTSYVLLSEEKEKSFFEKLATPEKRIFWGGVVSLSIALSSFTVVFFYQYITAFSLGMIATYLVEKNKGEGGPFLFSLALFAHLLIAEWTTSVIFGWAISKLGFFFCTLSFLFAGTFGHVLQENIENTSLDKKSEILTPS